MKLGSASGSGLGLGLGIGNWVTAEAYLEYNCMALAEVCMVRVKV